MGDAGVPTTGHRTALSGSVAAFLKSHPDLHLGGDEDFHAEGRHHSEVFGSHNLPAEKQAPIGKGEFTAIRGPHGTTPLRVFYPRSTAKGGSKVGALVCFHGGSYTVGSVDEFENGLRILAEHSEMIVIGVEYRLAPEYKFPTQLDEYEAVVVWAQGPEGAVRGIDGTRVCGGGDSAGVNMTAASALRLRDEAKPNLKAQILLYPEARLPFDTPAASENNPGLYLECNGILFFADHYLPRASDRHFPENHPYVSPSIQSTDFLRGVPPAAVFTCVFDPLRDVGVEYTSKMQRAGVEVTWRHYANLTHGILQMAPWSDDAAEASRDVAGVMKKLASM